MSTATIGLAVVAIGAIVYVAGVERAQGAAAKAGAGAKAGVAVDGGCRRGRRRTRAPVRRPADQRED